MENWILFALISMCFAGLTSVIAKLGLANISGELGLTVRTIFVFGFVLSFAAVSVPMAEIAKLTRQNCAWLGLSGVTTTLSWIFYYKAIKLGEVSVVALIDEGSFVVAVIMAWIILGEQITTRTVVGGLLVVAGLVVVSRR